MNSDEYEALQKQIEHLRNGLAALLNASKHQQNMIVYNQKCIEALNSENATHHKVLERLINWNKRLDEENTKMMAELQQISLTN